MTNETIGEAAFETLAGTPETPAEARNGIRHVVSLSLTKLADGLINPKLVLSYLLNALGAPAALVAALVPIREAGALLPQVFLAHRLERMKMRRWMWVAGSVGQGIAAALITLAALTLEGAAAGWAFVAGIAALALSRAAASVSYKDILGKTIPKTRLNAVPWARYTVSAQAKLEKDGAVRTRKLGNLGTLDGAGANNLAVADSLDSETKPAKSKA